MRSKEYIHYGSNKFDIRKFNEFSGRKDEYFTGLNKPAKYIGLWASPVNANYGWKEYVEDNWGEESYRLKNSFKFTLRPDARILTVRCEKDIERYIKYDGCYIFDGEIDFRRIARRYDGMELIHGENWVELHDSYFYTWDCDSIIIWNPEVIVA